MRIDKLPLEIQDIVLGEQRKAGNDLNSTLGLDINTQNGNFDWESSEQGFDFWDVIDVGDYSDFYKKYPFKIGEACLIPDVKRHSLEILEGDKGVKVSIAHGNYGNGETNVEGKIVEVHAKGALIEVLDTMAHKGDNIILFYKYEDFKKIPKSALEKERYPGDIWADNCKATEDAMKKGINYHAELHGEGPKDGNPTPDVSLQEPVGELYSPNKIKLL